MMNDAVPPTDDPGFSITNNNTTHPTAPGYTWNTNKTACITHNYRTKLIKVKAKKLHKL